MNREAEVLTHIIANCNKEWEAQLDLDNLPNMSKRTFFRTCQTLKEVGLLENVEGNIYRLLLPPLAIKDMDWLIESARDVDEIMYRMKSLHEKFFPGVRRTIEQRIDLCSRCKSMDECFSGKLAQCQMAPVPSGSGMISSYREEDQEREPVPSGTEENLERLDPRKLMQEKLAESRAAHENRPPSMVQRVKEVRAEWVEAMVEIHEFTPSPWGGKEHKMVPKLIGDHGLELTKKAVRLYLKSWSEIRAENAWIDTDTPTFGLFWYFREMLFAAVQGKGVIGGKSRKRTADECHDDDEDYTGGWGDADEASSAPSA
jgi:hypothetical protein